MNNIITLPNGKVFNFEKDELTTEDYRILSGVEVRHIRGLQEKAVAEKFYNEAQELYDETGIIIGMY